MCQNVSTVFAPKHSQKCETGCEIFWERGENFKNVQHLWSSYGSHSWVRNLKVGWLGAPKCYLFVLLIGNFVRWNIFELPSVFFRLLTCRCSQQKPIWLSVLVTWFCQVPDGNGVDWAAGARTGASSVNQSATRREPALNNCVKMSAPMTVN